MPCRIPSLSAFALGAALLASAQTVAPIATPVAAEPRPGTVAGLDLSTPERAAMSFVRAWADGDYFVAYLALDPILRFRFREAVETYSYQRVFGVFPPGDFFDQFKTHLVENAFSAETPAWSVDVFAEFEATLRAGADLGVPLPRFDPGAMGDPVASPRGDPGATLARVAVPAAAGGGILVLRRSPGGRWRLAGIEKRDLAEFWAYRPD